MVRVKKHYVTGFWGIRRAIAGFNSKIAENQLRIDVLEKYKRDILWGIVPNTVDVPPYLRKKISRAIKIIRKSGWIGTSDGRRFLDSIVNAHEQANETHRRNVEALKKMKVRRADWAVRKRRLIPAFKPA
jgi:hypothetical protein